MNYATARDSDAAAIEHLFMQTFAESEGLAEGQMIRQLARDLIRSTPANDLHCFVARDNAQIIGSMICSRITFEPPAIQAFILAPVAVHPDHQGQGIGQRLLRFGLHALAKAGVELALTYGDPRFYSKVGFQPISTERIPAPLDLQQPQGWLAQSLSENAIPQIAGTAACVAALNNPAYW